MTYEGKFLDDKKSGYGVYKWPDGREYCGWWYQGSQHGYGIFTDIKGKKKHGFWEEGTRKTWFTKETIAKI